VAATNDFYLKFGSNANTFARNLKTGVDAAYSEINRLDEAVKGLNDSLNKSPAKGFLANLQTEMSSIGTAVVADIQKALSQSNLTLKATVDVGSTPPKRGKSANVLNDAPNASSTTNVSASAIISAFKAEMKGVGEAISETITTELSAALVVHLPEAIKSALGNLPPFEAEGLLGVDETTRTGVVATRNAGPKDYRAEMANLISLITVQIQAFKEGKQPDFTGLPSRIEDAIHGGQKMPESKVFASALTEIEKILAGLDSPKRAKGAEAAAQKLLDEVKDPVVATQRAVGGGGISSADIEKFHLAALLQANAAEDMAQSINEFGAHLETLKATLSNIRVTVEGGEGGSGPSRGSTSPQTYSDAAMDPRLAMQIQIVSDAMNKAKEQVPKARRDAGLDLGSFDESGNIQPGKDRARMTRLFKNQAFEEALTEVGATLGQDEFGDENVDRILQILAQGGNRTSEALAAAEAMLRANASPPPPPSPAATEGNAAIKAELDRAQKELDELKQAVNEQKSEPSPTPSAVRPVTDASEPSESSEVLIGEANAKARREQVLRQKTRDILTRTDAPGASVSQDEELNTAGNIQQDLLAGIQVPAFNFDAWVERAIQTLKIGGTKEVEADSLQAAIRDRLQGVFRQLDDEMVEGALEFLRTYTVQGAAGVSSGLLGGTTQIGSIASEIKKDPAFERQRKFSRALLLSQPVVAEDGPGSIAAATRGGSGGVERINELFAGVGADPVEGGTGVRLKAQAQLAKLRAELASLLDEMEENANIAKAARDVAKQKLQMAEAETPVEDGRTNSSLKAAQEEFEQAQREYENTDMERFGAFMRLATEARTAAIEQLRDGAEQTASVLESAPVLIKQGGIAPPTKGMPKFDVKNRPPNNLPGESDVDYIRDVPTDSRDVIREQAARAQQIVAFSKAAIEAEGTARALQILAVNPNVRDEDLYAPTDSDRTKRIQEVIRQKVREYDQAAIDAFVEPEEITREMVSTFELGSADIKRLGVGSVPGPIPSLARAAERDRVAVENSAALRAQIELGLVRRELQRDEDGRALNTVSEDQSFADASGRRRGNRFLLGGTDAVGSLRASSPGLARSVELPEDFRDQGQRRTLLRLDEIKSSLSPVGGPLSKETLRSSSGTLEEAFMARMGGFETQGGVLVALWNELVEDAQRLLLLEQGRADAMLVQYEQQKLRAAGEFVDPKQEEMVARILESTPDVGGELTAVLRQLYEPGQLPIPANDEGTAQSLADLIFQGERMSTLQARYEDAPEDPAIVAGRRAMQETRVRLATEQGLDPAEFELGTEQGKVALDKVLNEMLGVDKQSGVSVLLTEFTTATNRAIAALEQKTKAEEFHVGVLKRHEDRLREVERALSSIVISGVPPSVERTQGLIDENPAIQRLLTEKEQLPDTKELQALRAFSRDAASKEQTELATNFLGANPDDVGPLQERLNLLANISEARKKQVELAKEEEEVQRLIAQKEAARDKALGIREDGTVRQRGERNLDEVGEIGVFKSEMENPKLVADFAVKELDKDLKVLKEGLGDSPEKLGFIREKVTIKNEAEPDRPIELTKLSLTGVQAEQRATEGEIARALAKLDPVLRALVESPDAVLDLATNPDGDDAQLKQIMQALASAEVKKAEDVGRGEEALAQKLARDAGLTLDQRRNVASLDDVLKASEPPPEPVPVAGREQVLRTLAAELEAANGAEEIAALLQSAQQMLAEWSIAETVNATSEFTDALLEARQVLSDVIPSDRSGEPSGARTDDGRFIDIDNQALDARKQAELQKDAEHAKEFKKSDEINASLWAEALRALSLDDIYLVHETSFPVERDEQGNVTLRPAGDYEEGLPRESLHFALNHLVEGVVGRAEGGAREGGEPPRAIVSKLSDVLAANPGALDNLLSVDTFLTPKPDEPLRLPNATVIEGSQTEAGKQELAALLREREALPFTGGSRGSEMAGLDARIAELAQALGVTSLPHDDWRGVEGAFKTALIYANDDEEIKLPKSEAESLLYRGGENYRERSAMRDIWEDDPPVLAFTDDGPGAMLDPALPEAAKGADQLTEAALLAAEALRGLADQTSPAPDPQGRTGFRLSETTEGRVKDLQFLQGGKVSQALKAQAGPYPSDGTSGEKNTFSGVRNILARLAQDTSFTFGENVRARGSDFLGPDAKFKSIPPALIAAAQDSALKAEAKLLSDPEVVKGNIQAEGDDKLISTLTSLDTAISKLAACCESMKEALGGFGRPGSDDPGVNPTPRKGMVRVNDEEYRKMIQGDLKENILNAINNPDGPDMRTAALELVADPNLNFSPTNIKQALSAMLDATQGKPQGSTPTLNETEARDVQAAAVYGMQLRAQSPEALQAFRDGPTAENAGVAGIAIVKASGDVNGAVQLVTDAFKLTSVEAQGLRKDLEELQARLEKAGTSAQQRAEDEKAERAKTPRSQALREMVARDMYTDSEGNTLFDPKADPRDNAVAVGTQVLKENPFQSVSAVFKNLEKAYGQLDAATISHIETTLRATQADLQREATLKANIAAQEESARSLNALRELLPAADRAQLDAGQLTAGEVTRRIDAKTGLHHRGNETGIRDRAAIQTLLDAGGGPIDASAQNTVDRYLSSVNQALRDREGSTQGALIARIFGPGGMVASVTRSAGLMFGRMIGGQLTYGLVARIRELSTAALEAEQTFVRITGALDATQRSATGVRRSLQDIAVETNVSVADTYEVMAQLVGVFKTTEEALQATRIVNQLELISQGALNAREGFRVLSAVTIAFQEELEGVRGFSDTQSIAYIADLATRIQDLTGVNIEDTTEGLARLGETAATLGIDMELIASAVALTAKATGQTGQASSEQLGRILSNFQNADAQDLLVSLGVTDQQTVLAQDFNQVMRDLFTNYDNLSNAEQRNIANQLGDPRQFATTMALLNQGSNVLQTFEDSLNAVGAADERQDKILSTFRGQVGQLGKDVQILVQGFIDLGALNVFSVVVATVKPLLDIVNNILQAMNEFKDGSAFGGIITWAASFAAGLAIISKLVKVILSDMFKIPIENASLKALGAKALRPITASALGKSTTAAALSAPRIRDGFRAGFTTQKQALQIASTGTNIAAAKQTQDAVKLSAALKNVTAGAGAASASLLRLPAVMGKFLLSPVGLIAAGLGLALFVDSLLKGGREVTKFYESLADRRVDQFERSRPISPETEDIDRRKEKQKAIDEIQNEDGSTRIANFSAQALKTVFKEAFQRSEKVGFTGGFEEEDFAQRRAFFASLTTFGSEATRTPVSGAIKGGELPDRVQTRIDGFEGDVAGASDARTAIKARNNILEQYREVIDELSTPLQVSNASEKLESLLKKAERQVAEFADAQLGITKAYNFTQTQLDNMLELFGSLRTFDSASLATYGKAISAIISSQTDLPIQGENILRSITETGQTFGQRQAAIGAALAAIYAEQERELQEAIIGGDPIKIQEANKKFAAVVNMRLEYDRQVLQSLVDIPKQQGEFANRLGDFDAAARFLQNAAGNALRNARAADAGSPERTNALNEFVDLRNKAAQAGIQNELDALERASAQTRSPSGRMANDVASAQARLKLLTSTPGNYQEVQSIFLELARLQQSVADEQRSVADAYASLRALQARNPLASANIQYAEALKKYRRAIAEGEGGAAVIAAAREVEEAAKAVRAAQEGIRAASAKLAIAKLPRGDSLARAMAELSEAFARQREAIREFGRNSAEYLDSVTEVVNQQQAIEDEVRNIVAAQNSVASSLARAAGLTVRSSRLDLENARANLEQARRDAGGNENAASVKEAYAGVIDAEAALRDTILNEALGTIDFMQSMEQITEQQAITALRGLLNTMDLTQEQQRNIQLKIKGIQDSINGSMEGQFNLGDIRVPTPYEIRRGFGIDRIMEGVEEAELLLDDAFNTKALGPFPTRATTGGGSLDQILGPDLAAELANLRGDTQNLLPPLKDVPTLIDTTVSMRDEVAAAARAQLDELISLREGQSAATEMIGAVVDVPLSSIGAGIAGLDALLEEAVAYLEDMANRELPPLLDGRPKAGSDDESTRLSIKKGPRPRSSSGPNFDRNVEGNIFDPVQRSTRDETRRRLGLPTFGAASEVYTEAERQAGAHANNMQRVLEEGYQKAVDQGWITASDAGKKGSTDWGTLLNAIMAKNMLTLNGVTAGGSRELVTGMLTELGIGAKEVATIVDSWVRAIADGLEPIIVAVGGKPFVVDNSADRVLLTRSERAQGGIDNLPGDARIQAPGTIIQWAEPETGGEAFIPLAPSKRPRSKAIWKRTGELLGMDVSSFARGGFTKAPEELKKYGLLGDIAYEAVDGVGVQAASFMDRVEPFYEDDGGNVRSSPNSNQYGGVKPWVAWSGNVITKVFGPMPGGIGGVGARANKSDHPTGHALDFMVGDNSAGHSLGDRLSNYLLANWSAHAMKYLIWKQRISYGGNWRGDNGSAPPMANRGSRTANHWDHPHASYKDSAGSGYIANLAPSTAPARTATPTFGGGKAIAADGGMLNHSGPFSLHDIEARATGGQVLRNRPYLVGEEGAELFVPQTNGNIVSNTDLDSFRPTTVNNYNNIDQSSVTHISINGADLVEVKRILNQYLGPQAAGTVTSGSSGQRRL
jgi:hypothetical protein